MAFAINSRPSGFNTGPDTNLCLATVASRFAQACGRQTVRAEDMAIAAKYEAHEFFARDGLEERVAEVAVRQAAEEEEGGDEGESDEGESDGDEDSGDEEAGGEDGGGEGGGDGASKTPYTTAFKRKREDDEEAGRTPSDELRRFHAACLSRSEEWEAWAPLDPVQSLLKRSIDHSDEVFPPFLDATNVAT